MHDPSKPTKGKDTTLEGLLVPVRWTAAGEVASVCLMAFDEGEYPLAVPGTETRKLTELLRKPVRLRCELRDGNIVAVAAVEPLVEERT